FRERDAGQRSGRGGLRFVRLEPRPPARTPRRVRAGPAADPRALRVPSAGDRGLAARARRVDLARGADRARGRRTAPDPRAAGGALRAGARHLLRVLLRRALLPLALLLSPGRLRSVAA